MLEEELDLSLEVADGFYVKVGRGNCELTS